MVFKALRLNEVIVGAIRMKMEESLKNFLKILIFGSCIGKGSTVQNENKFLVMSCCRKEWCGMRGRPHSRSHSSPWKGHRVWVPGFSKGRIQERATVKRKAYSGIHRLQKWSVGCLRKQEAPGYGVLTFYRAGQFHRLMSQRSIPSILGRGGISRNWAPTHFLAFYGQLQNCHGACGYVIQLPDVLQ